MKRYKHYKGEIYDFLFVAKHSETNEDVVVYKNSKNEIFVRPAKMFYEEIEVNGKKVKRFEEEKVENEL